MDLCCQLPYSKRLQNRPLFSAVTVNLKWLEMSINLYKSCCLRISPPSNIICAAVTNLTGHKLARIARQQFTGYNIPLSSFFRMSYIKILKIGWFFSESCWKKMARGGRFWSPGVLILCTYMLTTTSRITQPIFTKFGGKMMAHGTRKKPLDLGGNPDHVTLR